MVTAYLSVSFIYQRERAVMLLVVIGYLSSFVCHSLRADNHIGVISLSLTSSFPCHRIRQCKHVRRHRFVTRLDVWLCLSFYHCGGPIVQFSGKSSVWSGGGEGSYTAYFITTALSTASCLCFILGLGLVTKFQPVWPLSTYTDGNSCAYVTKSKNPTPKAVGLPRFSQFKRTLQISKYQCKQKDLISLDDFHFHLYYSDRSVRHWRGTERINKIRLRYPQKNPC